MLTALIIATGLVVGSFLNVCIHRIPLGRSIVFPGSHCPDCGAPIRSFDNVPVASWLLLRGRCRSCRAPISVRYPAVELANAILWLAAARNAGEPANFARQALFCSALLVLMMIDFDHQILPDIITLPLVAAGLAFSAFRIGPTLTASAVGALAGGGGLWLVAFLYARAAGQEGMGLGDVKMLAAIGAFTGAAGVVVTILFASFSGSIVGLLMIGRGGSMKSRLPFGVFLGAAAIAALFWADPIVAWYRGWIAS